MVQRPTPGFVTGTSSEYLGRRPLRKMFRERGVVVILGPEGVGKTSVARRIAGDGGSSFLYLDSHVLKDEVVKRVRRGRWSRPLVQVDGLVLDGPTYLTERPAVEHLLFSLIEDRIEAGLRTIICDVSGDGSAEALMARMPAGCMVVLGLRFPKSRSGRMRFARRHCDLLDLPRSVASGTDQIDPWRYDEVISVLEQARRVSSSG